MVGDHRVRQAALSSGGGAGAAWAKASTGKRRTKAARGFIQLVRFYHAPSLQRLCVAALDLGTAASLANVAEAFSRAASLTWILLMTFLAPAVLAIRVAEPLRCTTSVLPSMVATPP